MPLIDNSKFKEHNKSMDDVIEVIVAVVVPPKVRVLELIIPTVQLRAFIITRKLNKPLKSFHSNDGKYIVKHLQTNNMKRVSYWILTKFSNIFPLKILAALSKHN